jgi:hypothetical protein
MSRDGSHLFFYADGPFTTNDTNNRPNVYDVFERSNGETTLVTAPSPGNPSGGGEFVGSSADGSRVFFAAEGGIYERSNGVTTFVSAPGPGGVSDPNPQTFNFGAISDNGTRVMWLSSARMTVADTDDRPDLYQAVLDDTESPAPGGDVAGAVSSPPGVHIERVAWPKTVTKLISKGVRVLVSCDSDCKLSLSVRARKAVDGLAKGAEIAHGKGSVGGGQDRWLTAKLTRTAARAFGAHAGELDFSRVLRVTGTSR